MMKKPAIGLLAIVATLFLLSCGRIPTITSLEPAEGTVGTQVKITGTNYRADQGSGKVTFGDTTVTGEDLVSWSDTEIVVKVPEGLPPSELRVRVTNDDGVTSNGKRFVVLKSEIRPGQIAVVANQSQPGFQVFRFEEATAGGYSTPETLFEIGVKEDQFKTTIRGIASAPAQRKIYVAVERQSLAGDDDRSDLLVFERNDEGEVTAPTRIDVGVLPTGMALSPNGDRLYVAASAGGMLTVVNTLTDEVDEDITVDLFERSYGFEPLNVAVLRSNSDGGHIVAVVGNNWSQLAGEILTYAPLATDANRKFQGALRLPELDLNGAVAVSRGTSKLWVLGEMQAGAGIAMVDPVEGTIAGSTVFGPDGVDAGFSADVSDATDVFAAGGAFYVAFPHHGVGAFGVPTDSTQIYDPALSKLIAFDGARKIAPLRASSGPVDSLLVTREEAGTVARVQPGLGEVDVSFMSTATTPTLIHTFSTGATDGTP